MIGQPLGCILVLCIGICSLGAAFALVWSVSIWRDVPFVLDGAAIILSFGMGFLIFFPLMELGHQMEIRWFFKKLNLRIIKIHTFKNHYRVDYFRDGKKLSGKWPKDFEALLRLKDRDTKQ